MVQFVLQTVTIIVNFIQKLVSVLDAVIILYLYGLVSISAGQGVSFLGVQGSYPIKTLALYAVCW